jgi:hypothetical protein
MEPDKHATSTGDDSEVTSVGRPKDSTFIHSLINLDVILGAVNALATDSRISVSIENLKVACYQKRKVLIVLKKGFVLTSVTLVVSCVECL